MIDKKKVIFTSVDTSGNPMILSVEDWRLNAEVFNKLSWKYKEIRMLDQPKHKGN